MSSPDDNVDLQAYLDSLRKEIDQSDDCVALTPEALKALSEADVVTEKLLEDVKLDAYDDDLDQMDSHGKMLNKQGIYLFKLSGDKKTITLNLNDKANLQIPQTNLHKSEAAENNDENKEKLYEFDEDGKSCEDADYNSGGEPPLLSPNTKFIHTVQDSNGKTDTTMHQCSECSYKTNKRFLMSRHMKTHSSERPFKCSFCDRGFKFNAALMNHVNAHLGKKPHACKECDKRFNTGGELVRHMRYMHTGEKPHKCGECDYSSVELSKMRRHMRCHTGERPYQCPHCTYASPDTFKLKRHLRTHTGEKPYECDICLARFTQSNTLKAHRLIHSVGERPVFQCTLCPTTCGRKVDLQMHMQKLHHSDHPIKCKRCDKELPDRYSYKVHVKTHEGEKCFRCSICPYASISKPHLEMHMRIHTDEKPFECEHCSATFRQRQLLVRHNNIYHNANYVPPTPMEKSHVCPHCKRSFTRKGNLMRHMELHDSQVDVQEQKIRLKIGQKIRIQPDGSLVIPDVKVLNALNAVVEDDASEIIVKETTEFEDQETKFKQKFEIVEEIGVGSSADYEDGATVKNSNLLTILNSKKVKPETQLKPKTRVVVMPKTAKKNRTISISNHSPPNKIERTLVAIKNEQLNKMNPEFEEEENFMVIEVFDDESIVNGDIVEIPFQSNQKQEVAQDAYGFDSSEYILPVDMKPAHITIMDVMDEN